MTQGRRGESFVWPPLPDWQDQAACRGMGAEKFHVPNEIGRGNGKVNQPLIDAAKAVCARCPVAAECLEEAMLLPRTLDYYTGAIRGGKTPFERRPECSRRTSLRVAGG